MKKNKCWECYQEIESDLESGKWKQASLPMIEWHEMMNAEKKLIKEKLLEIKPEKVLEIGAGSGRIIEIVLKNSGAKITAIEKNRELCELVKQRFKGNERAEIINSENPPSKKFDLALCMMNTLGNQENERELIEKALSVSGRMLFTLYKKGSEKIRQEIYRERGHKDFALRENCFYFNDNWVKGLISKNYSKEDIEKILSGIHCNYKILELSKIAYCVEAEKKPGNS